MERFWEKLGNNEEFTKILIKNPTERIDSVMPMSVSDSNYFNILINRDDAQIRLRELDTVLENQEHIQEEQRRSELQIINELRLNTKLDSYIHALNEEANKSPNTSNLKIMVKLFGHEAAFKYYESDDYKSRKEYLENRTEQELDIQRSRHYLEGRDYSPLTPSIDSPLLRKILKKRNSE